MNRHKAADHVRALVQQLREARQAVSLSQVELARKVGVSNTAISKREVATNQVALVTLVLWADTVGLTVTLTPKEKS